MPLLDLKTDLKSLKYGKDRPGGGDSGQPYQKVDINTVDSGFNRFRMTNFDDGLVRGGVVGAANASIVDTLRIGKFLKDFPKGPLFIVKQVGLQLSNPALETKKITIGNGRGVLGFIGNTLSAINNTLGPTRIYNLGINTIAQVPVNAFGIHFNRHGLLPVQDDQTKYLAVAQFNNEGGGSPKNRLVGLKNRFNLGDRQTENIPGFNNRKKRKLLAQVINNIVFGGIIKKPKPIGFLDANKELTVDRYIGGPGSVYGIGNTTIPRKTFTEDKSKIDLALEQSQILAGNTKDNNGDVQKVKLKDTFDFEISNKTNSSLASTSFNLSNDNINNSLLSLTASIADKNNKFKPKIPINPVLTFISASTYSNSDLSKDSFDDLTSDGNLRTTLKDKNINTNTYSGSITWTPSTGPKIVNKDADLELSNLTTGTKEDIDVNDFTTKGENTIKYTPSAIATGNVAKYAELRKKVDEGNNIQQNYFNTVPASKIDKKAKKYNAIELNRTNDIVVNDDALALYFTPLDPFTGQALNTLKFLGYINNYSEDYNSSWGDVKYAGRGEKFYIFNEFKRTATVDFNIPCYNYEELLAKHCLLSELASTLAGKYQDNLLLGGIITKLKVGNYINNQPGIITNLNFSPIQDSSWDLDAELAFYLKVSFGFTLIHNYLPQYTKCGFIYKAPDPILPPPPSPPEITPAPTPPVTSSIIPTNNTGSLKPLGRVDLRDRPDTTFVRKPYILDDLKKVSSTKYGGGSFGGGGAGGKFVINP